MKFKVYRIEAMGECEAATLGEAIEKAHAADVRFNQAPDCRFIALEDKPVKKAKPAKTEVQDDGEE